MDTPDPFLIPGTDTLRNRFDEHDPDRLATIERLFARERAMQGLMGVIISPDGLRGLHRHLFQDVYPWAGQTRQSMTLSKGDAFLHGRFVDGALAKQFDLLKAEKNLTGLTAGAFAERAAFHIGEINFIHPFREGNGRTMRLFLRELAHRAGHKLDISRIDDRAWMQASIAANRTQDYRPMAAVIVAAITGRVQELKGATRSIRARLELAAASAELAKHLPAAVREAERKLATVLQARRDDAQTSHLAVLQRWAERTLEYLKSQRGPAHQLDLLRAAQVEEITAAGRKPQTALDRVLAIGRAADQAVDRLPEQVRAQALARVQARGTGSGP
jgi:cell filamentation protein